MSDQYVGEIRWFTYVRGAPEGWQLCDGSLMSISGNEVLYTLLGTTYGGDGQTTFGVPDLRGRLALHQGPGTGLTPRVLGQSFGTETVTLTNAQLGGHTHVLEASSAMAASTSPTGNVPAQVASGDTLYISGTAGASPAPISPTSIGSAGGSQPHENCAPTLPLVAAIATVGLFPPQS